MSKCGKIAIGVVAVTWVIAVWAYSVMPEMMVTHWGLYGQPNGFAPKWIGVFFLPILSVVLWAALTIIPKMDPLGKNINKFKETYDQFICGILEFMAFIYVLSLAWNLGYKFDLVRVLAAGMGVLYMMVGRLLPKTEPNWSIGVRTPWTIANPKVWRKTNDLAGKLFTACGVITLVNLVWPRLGIVLVVVPVILVAIGVSLYSYVEYRRIKKSE